MFEGMKEVIVSRVMGFLISTESLNIVLARYEHRPYHGWNHLTFLYGLLEKDAVRDIAVLFHDYYSLCDKDAPDNDDDCVERSVYAAKTMVAPKYWNDEIENYINVTKYHSEPITQKERELKNADWAGFFAPLPTYQSFSLALMDEMLMTGISLDAYIQNRTVFLEKVTTLPHIQEMMVEGVGQIHLNIVWELRWLCEQKEMSNGKEK